MLLAAPLLLLPILSARAEVVVAHNDRSAASAAYQFKSVPVPRQNAAAGATFTLLDGVADGASGALDVLRDARLPDEEDQPEANFFFRNGSDGGRVLVDLGKVIPVKEIDIYSWHAAARAPQVYKVYGSDGGGAGFAAAPRRPQDPAQCGWKLVAAVDTRAAFGMAGGQYGVSLTEAGGVVGTYRYLLFDVARTDEHDPFGNTFFSELDVIDRDAPANPAPAAHSTREASTYNQNGIQLVVTNDSPGFDPREKERLAQTFFAVYPQMMAEFNRQAPKAVKLSIETRYHGVAATGANGIHVNPDWFRRNPEDLDVMTHEGMHVVQQYTRGGPGWLTEGIADYARYKFGVNNRAAAWTLPDYRAGQSYTDAYRVTARFLAWLEKHVKPGLVVALDQAMRAGTYTPEVWKQQTGKDVDALWQDYTRSPTL